jgi:uncharacterized membrane protein
MQAHRAISPSRSEIKLRASSTKIALVATLVLYAFARVLEILPLAVPSIGIVALEVLSALAFALIHGAQQYRLRGILVFAGICLVVGNALENLSIFTGFPFGHYRFLTLMGPQLFHVPILLGLAYVGMAYVSWTLALLISRATQSRLTGPRFVAVPLLASFIMTAWDLAQDPVWGTILHAWRWRDGGRWFGVPLTNFVGWLLTMFLIYLLFALYLRCHPVEAPAHSIAHSGAAVLYYALCAAGNVLQTIPTPTPAFVADATGKLWRATDITLASALVSVFVMGSFALFAWVRIARQQDGVTG